MEEIIQGLNVDPLKLCKNIEEKIRSTLKSLNRDGAVIGLSGGLDSAVAAKLTVRSLGAEKVHLVNLPEKDSKKIHRDHAKQFAKHLGIHLNVKHINSILRATGTYKLLPLRFIPGRKLRTNLVKFGRKSYIPKDNESILLKRLKPKAYSWLAKANAYIMAKHRIRMVILYQYAEVRNLMIVGAANRTEWLTGTFSKWGVDHCADIMPIVHLYRTQLEQLAEYIQIPEYIRNKAADPDIMPTIDDKGDMLNTFILADQILYGIENNIDKSTLCQEYGEKNVEQLYSLWEYSKHMRESPYYID
ncbi:MAG: NAD(+) synthase [Promethearchaeota archaeon]